MKSIESEKKSALKRLFGWKWVVSILIIAAAGYLTFTRLDNTYFWDDEAKVAIIASNFLSTGRLTGWDGRNLMALRNGSVLREDLSTIDPPLDILLTAASFQLFGRSTWAGRFPFVFAGMVSLVIFVFLLQDEFHGKTALQIYGLVLLAFSVVFLLHIRQCRYYALSILFSLLTYWMYRRCLSTKQFRYFTLLPIAAALLFYSNYLPGTAFLLALGIVHLSFHRRELRGPDWLKTGCSLGIFLLATAPYAIYYQIWYRPDMIPDEPWYIRGPALFWWNIREINAMGSMPWMLLVLLICFLIWLWKKEPAVRVVFRWLALSLVYILILSVLSPQPTAIPVMADIRYLIPVIPFLAGIQGATLYFIHKSHRHGRFLAWALLVILVTTNLLTLAPQNTKFKWHLPAYIHEVHHPFPTSYRLVCEYLERNAQKDDLVLADPEYCNYPIMFYLGHKVRFCCLLTQKTLLGNDRVKKLAAPLMIDENFPDWYISFGLRPSTKKLLRYFSRPHRVDGQVVQHRYRLAKVLDVLWFDTSNPDFQAHTFGPVTDFDRRTDSVYVFKRFDSKSKDDGIVKEGIGK